MQESDDFDYKKYDNLAREAYKEATAIGRDSLNSSYSTAIANWNICIDESKKLRAEIDELKKQRSADKFTEIFDKQESFMRLLKDNDKMVEWPVDLTSKPGQRLIKETVFNMIEELAEASFTLKNRMHRITDARALDIDHFKEELGDALAYFIEVCVLSGITADELFKEYVRKNKIVAERLRDGY